MQDGANMSEVNLENKPEVEIKTPSAASPSPNDVAGGTEPAPKQELWFKMRGKVQAGVRAARSVVPVGAGTELKELFLIAWPVILSQLLTYTVILTSLIFAGRVLGKEPLDGVSMASTFINLTGVTVGFGLSFGLDTLLSQTYGSANKKRVGVIIQRGTIIIMLFCFPCWALYCNTESIMKVVGLDTEVAEYAAKYCLWFIPGLPGMILLQIINKYLQNQNLVMPPLWIGLAMNVVNIVLHCIFILGIKMSVDGAAISIGLSFWIACLMTVGYIKFYKLHEETWGGWSVECLQEWGVFFYLALPGLAMMGIEFWNYELGTFLSGILPDGKDELAASFITPIGLAVAASIRVGQALGAGEHRAASVTTRVSLFLGLCIVLLIGILYSTLRYVIPGAFTPVAKIRDRAAQIILQLALSQCFDGMQQVCGGILRGCGRQTLGACVNFIGFYIIGMPVGLPLMFKTKLGIAGHWWGNVLASAFQAIVFNIVIYKTDWKKFSDSAQVRAGVKFDEKKVRPDDEGEATEEKKEEPVKDDKLNEKGMVANGISGKIEDDGTYFAMELEEEKPSLITLDTLSTKQLILYRGGAVAAAFLILIIGIILSVTIKVQGRPPACQQDDLSCNGCTLTSESVKCMECNLLADVDVDSGYYYAGHQFAKYYSKWHSLDDNHINYHDNGLQGESYDWLPDLPDFSCGNCVKQTVATTSGQNRKSSLTLDCGTCATVRNGMGNACNVTLKSESCRASKILNGVCGGFSFLI
ncbi:unnamed protein product [Owenia fusiformis]|uniref:Multidrug and toxin extrusion protein n=1 Tax=Owenia fusiformis TaxID=6347 RepID=A0A8J1XK33_OWEFU|nr:unnamed protein product [Owenia fusiformis]